MHKIDILKIPVCYQSLNDKGEIRWINDKWEKLTGYKLNEVKGKLFSDFITSGSRKTFKKKFQLILKEGEANDVSISFVTKSNKEVHVVLNGVLGKQDDMSVAHCVLMDVSDRDTMINQLEKSKEELRGLARHLEYVREEERAIMARELHDELGQTLTAVKFDLMFMRKELKSPPKSVNLNETLRLLEDSIDLTRQLGAKLRPGVIDDLGLGPAIEWLIENFQKRTLVELDMEITAEAREVDKDASIAVFRIIQEAITNIMRHSCATATKVRFREYKKGKYEFYIKDNGVGFNPAQVNRNKCFGLMGMAERAKLIGGKVRVDSSPGKGTKVSIFI